MASEHPKEFAHTMKRLKERYGACPLSPHAFYDSLCEATMKTGLMVKDEPKSNQGIYRVEFSGMILFVTWSRERECVTTVLPPKAFDEEDWFRRFKEMMAQDGEPTPADFRAMVDEIPAHRLMEFRATFEAALLIGKKVSG